MPCMTGCKGGIAAWPAKKALLFTNDATTKGRVNVTLRVSTDDGLTQVTFISSFLGELTIIIDRND